MKTDIPLLQNVRVASPCPASWEGMTIVDGDRVHFCQECQKRVYNLSAMRQAEAEGLLRKHEGRLCVRYYQRSDGTVLTNDCPVGLQAARQLVFRRARTSFALVLVYCAAMAAMRYESWVRDSQPTTGVLVIDTAPVETNKEKAKNSVPDDW